MGRIRADDFINWRLYRRAFAPAVLALLVLAVTSFQPEAPAPATLPPTFTNSDAATLVHDATAFDKHFPRRVPGSASDLDAAQFIRDSFRQRGIATRLVPGTTTVPGHGGPIGIANVEATIPGRTPETVVIYAHRDTTANMTGGDAVSTLALLRMADDLTATQDRRRTYLLVSTDAATANGAGARLLADRLANRHGGVIAAIGLDRIAADQTPLTVSTAPTWRHSPPLGLVTMMRGALTDEGVKNAASESSFTQALRLAAPVTLREHGKLLARGLPAITLSSDRERISDTRSAMNTSTTGTAIRALQRTMIELDGLDSVQSAGKTWALGSDRVWRGWAIKLLIAGLLVPVWVAAAAALVRFRRIWNVAGAIGTVARAALAGMLSLMILWTLSSWGLLPASGDMPPMPGLPGSGGALGLIVWGVLTAIGWILARGPDWRRADVTGGRDNATVVVALMMLSIISVLALSVNPFAVMFALPALHGWLWLASRRVFDIRAVLGVWCIGLIGPMVACLVVAQTLDTGLGTPGWLVELAAMRGIPPMLLLLTAAAGGASAVLLTAALGRTRLPALPGVRRRIALIQNQLARAIATGQARSATPPPQRPRRIPPRTPSGRLDQAHRPIPGATPEDSFSSTSRRRNSRTRPTSRGRS